MPVIRKVAKLFIAIIGTLIIYLLQHRIELFRFQSASISSFKLNVMIYGGFYVLLLFTYLYFRLKQVKDEPEAKDQ